MLSPITISDAALGEQDAAAMVNIYNAGLESLVRNIIKSPWEQFWNPQNSVERMQSQIDTLCLQSTTFNGAPSNQFLDICRTALTLIDVIQGAYPSAFTDASMEASGALQPNGQPYQRYLTPGWYYTVDGTTGRVIVSGPCQF